MSLRGAEWLLGDGRRDQITTIGNGLGSAGSAKQLLLDHQSSKKQPLVL